MSKDRIENNPTYQKFKTELEGAETLSKLAKFLSFFGIKNDGLNEAFESLPEFRSKLDQLSKSPDKFNDHFAKRGWIAHESMNTDLLLTAVELAEKGMIDVAELELVNYYSSERMHWLVGQLRGIEAFSIRYNLFRLAYEDTLTERFHAVVPLLLMMIDGTVNDIDKSKGFFAENTNLTAWDSIAAHSTGLSVLKEIFNEVRKKTTQEEITFPFRHGILHGRDLGYANKVVAAKCWAAVFALKDWAHALKQGKKTAPIPEPKLSFRENLQQLKKALDDYSKIKKRGKILDEKISDWKAREIKIGIDVPAKGVSTEYVDFSPEQEAVRFAEYWSKKNFGAISKQIHHFSKPLTNEKLQAGKTRKLFEGKRLVDYRILEIKDCSPAITEVKLHLSIESDQNLHEKEVTLRLIYKGDADEILIFGDRGGQWKFIPSFFNEIEFLY